MGGLNHPKTRKHRKVCNFHSQSMVSISTSGGFLDTLAWALNNFALVFLCASTFGRSWEHATGDKNDVPKPRPNPTNETQPPHPYDYYLSPFDQCGKNSSHTVACGLFSSVQFFIVISIIVVLFSYIYERFPMVKKEVKKSHLVVGSLWFVAGLSHLVGVACWASFIQKNSAFFRVHTEGHPNLMSWAHGQAFNFGWIGVTLVLISSVMFIYYGFRF